MVRKNFFVLGLVSAMSLATVSCYDASVDNDDTIEVYTPTVQNTLKTESWRVSKYTRDGVSENDLSINSYVLKFEDDNIFTASHDSSTFTGEWEITNPVGNEDIKKLQLDLDMSDFDEIDRRWTITDINAEKIQLYYKGSTPTSVPYELELTKVTVEK